VVNHDLVNAMGNALSTGFPEQKDLGGEIVSFAIIERGFVAIDSGVNVQYIMDVSARANYAFSPKLYDAFANSLGVEENFG